MIDLKFLKPVLTTASTWASNLLKEVSQGYDFVIEAGERGRDQSSPGRQSQEGRITLCVIPQNPVQEAALRFMILRTRAFLCDFKMVEWLTHMFTRLT
jgi:hypothetical protein